MKNCCEKMEVHKLYDYMQNDMADSRSTFYGSKQIEVLCVNSRHKKIAQICGGPFSGKQRLAREFARKLNASSKNPSFCFKVDLLSEMKYSREESLEKSLIKFAVEEMGNHENFVDDIEELENSKYDMGLFGKFFSRKHRNSNFVFVFYNADVVSMTKEKTEFLETLKFWTSKCRNLFIVLTTQFKYTIYDDICLTHCCKRLEIKDAKQFLKDEIEIARRSYTDVVIHDPNDFQCKELVNLVKCWPFLIRVVAHDLKDYSADEMVELLTETPLLSLSNEAASKRDQLDSKLNNMVEQLSTVLKKYFFLFAEFPDTGRKLKIEQMMEVYDYESEAKFKREILVRFKTRSVVESDTSHQFKLIDFMDEHVADNAFGRCQPSAMKNVFNKGIIKIVESSLNAFVEGSEDEVARCRQGAAKEFKELVGEMKQFESYKHSKDRVMEDCENVIKRAEDFLKRATHKNAVPEFRLEADNITKKYCAGMKRTVSEDSAFNSDEGHSGSDTEVTVSEGPKSLNSTADNGENPLNLRILHQNLPEAHQAYSTQGPQAMSHQESDEIFQYNAQESPTGIDGGRRIVPSGHDSLQMYHNCCSRE